MGAHIDDLIEAVKAGSSLKSDETADIFEAFVSGELQEDAAESFLIALAEKGETPDEIAGAASVMRRHLVPIDRHDLDAIDTCGAGGDGISTFNVSTAAAIVAAGAGAKVAKHGNRTNSRSSGSAEALAALGVNLDAAPAVVSKCIQKAGIGFLFAANLHPAMRRAAPIRKRIRRRTIFNLLGPLVNPALVAKQVVGVPRPELLNTVLEALHTLGVERAMVVHGHDGLCDLTITGPSSIVQWLGDQRNQSTVAPEELGLRRAPIEALLVDSPQKSAAAIRDILAGETGPKRDHTLLNAGAALLVADIAQDLGQGIRMAAEAIDDGRASNALDALVEISNEPEKDR